MDRLQKSALLHSAGRMVLLVLAALTGTAIPSFSQGTLQGKFTLPVEARLGRTLLSPGGYKFYVESLGPLRSVSSIQAADNHVLVVVTGIAPGGPAVSLIATATAETDTPNPKAMDIRADGTGMKIHSMYLEEPGLMLVFKDREPRKTIHARGSRAIVERSIRKGN